MSPTDDDYKKKRKLAEQEDADGQSGETGGTGRTGQGGKSGQVAFRDFLAPAEALRDDLLPPDEKKRLLSVHKDAHELRVKKQKEVIEQRELVRNGKIPLQVYRQGVMGTGMNAEYKPNPVLANKAQFSGVDRQESALPTENVAETNQDKRNEYRLRYAPENAPRFNPKPLYR